MLHSPVRRGRPKGTGIDDNDRIARLDELLRVHPELRPTTAIRLMGLFKPIGDPPTARQVQSLHVEDAHRTFKRASRDRTRRGASLRADASGDAARPLRPSEKQGLFGQFDLQAFL